MTERSEEFAGLNRLVHEPARLVILTALASCTSADFLFLQRLTGLTKGNLSSHLTKLAAADLVKVEKRFLGKTPNTTVQITAAGLQAVEQHWQRLDAMRQETGRRRRVSRAFGRTRAGPRRGVPWPPRTP